MKKSLVVLALFSALTASHAALACSPPVPAFAQQNQLSLVLSSEAFRHALAEQTSVDRFVRIQQIDLSHGVQVLLTNGCTLKGQVEYLPPETNGMCPQFKGVTVETACQQ